MFKRVLLLVLRLKKLSWSKISFLPDPVGDSLAFLYIVNSSQRRGKEPRKRRGIRLNDT
jgi:hypothetical protein